jgi:hypothetical protein
MSSASVLAYSAPRTALSWSTQPLERIADQEALFFTDVLFAALAANRAKWSFRTSSPEVLAAVSDK